MSRKFVKQIKVFQLCVYFGLYLGNPLTHCCKIIPITSKMFSNAFKTNKERCENFWTLLGSRLSFSSRTHKHCSQEILKVTGNLDGFLSKIHLFDWNHIPFTLNTPNSLKLSQYQYFYYLGLNRIAQNTFKSGRKFKIRYRCSQEVKKKITPCSVGFSVFLSF